jgi:hypothetical protein
MVERKILSADDTPLPEGYEYEERLGWHLRRVGSIKHIMGRPIEEFYHEFLGTLNGGVFGRLGSEMWRLDKEGRRIETLNHDQIRLVERSIRSIEEIVV